MPLVPPYIESLKPVRRPGASIEEVQREYGLTRVAKLASNENPFGASPAGHQVHAPAASDRYLYPDGGLVLRQVLAAEFDLKVENVIAGSGSEGIMSNIIRAFLSDEDEVLTTDAAFIGFQVLAKSRGVNTDGALPRWHYDLAALAAEINDIPRSSTWPTRTILTGTIFTKSEFDDFLPARAGSRADHPGRSLFRICQGQSALSGFDALPLRQRHYATDLFEDLRTGRNSYWIWLRARGTDRATCLRLSSRLSRARWRRRRESERWRTRNFCIGRWS